VLPASKVAAPAAEFTGLYWQEQRRRARALRTLQRDLRDLDAAQQQQGATPARFPAAAEPASAAPPGVDPPAAFPAAGPLELAAGGDGGVAGLAYAGGGGGGFGGADEEDLFFDGGAHDGMDPGVMPDDGSDNEGMGGSDHVVMCGWDEGGLGVLSAC
jgi:hypothetical protein